MATYFTKITALGAEKLAAAAAGGPNVSLTQMAVGDGAGNPVPTPTGAETALVREVFRAPINSLSISTLDASTMVAELMIPAATGGFAIAEIGIFDAHGDLFAYGNFPATYKPTAAEGSTRDMLVQTSMKVSNTSSINLVIDNTVVGATRAWVLSTITPAYLLPGGTTQQVLRKKSNADGDTEWADATAALNVVVDVIKEQQTAAAGQWPRRHTRRRTAT